MGVVENEDDIKTTAKHGEFLTQKQKWEIVNTIVWLVTGGTVLLWCFHGLWVIAR